MTKNREIICWKRAIIASRKQETEIFSHKKSCNSVCKFKYSIRTNPVKPSIEGQYRYPPLNILFESDVFCHKLKKLSIEQKLWPGTQKYSVPYRYLMDMSRDWPVIAVAFVPRNDGGRLLVALLVLQQQVRDLVVLLHVRALVILQQKNSSFLLVVVVVGTHAVVQIGPLLASISGKLWSTLSILHLPVSYQVFSTRFALCRA